MKLYLISQKINTGSGTWGSAIVAHESPDGARMIHPNGGGLSKHSRSWVSFSDLDKINVEYLGEAKEGTNSGVIHAFFNAG